MTGTLPGTLWGIGVGPGDPELMTLKAHRLISTARVVAYPAPDDGDSFARRIAAATIPEDAEEIPMIVPMRAERFPAQQVYANAAERIAAHLDQGTDVAVLCEGDPFFYGSFMYLFGRLVERYPVEVVPGVSSLTACAARLSAPLATRNDVLTVLPAPLDEAILKARLKDIDAAAILKVGRHFDKVRRVLRELGLADKARYVEHATMASQKILPLEQVAAGEAPYFSMILVHRRGEAWR